MEFKKNVPNMNETQLEEYREELEEELMTVLWYIRAKKHKKHVSIEVPNFKKSG